MLQLLNEKVAENPDYVIPEGFKKVQELVIEDSYLVPDEIGMKESEKMALELLDEIFSKAVEDFHILHSVPVTRQVTKVVLDENKILVNYAEATRNMRSSSVVSNGGDSKGRSFKRGMLAPPFLDNLSRNSAGSGDARSISISPTAHKQLLSTP